MRIYDAFLLIVLACCQTLFALDVRRLNFSFVEEQFQLFIVRYGKSYQTGSAEYERRLQIFKGNLERFKELNDVPTNMSSKQSAAIARYGVTKFSDLTPEEFQGRYLSDMKATLARTSHTPWLSSRHYVKPSVQPDIPKQFDWRDHGVITTPRDQKSCGGCWAFSAVETVESTYAITHRLSVVPLSVQQVLDCSYGFELLSGCQGGDTCEAFSWIMENNIHLVPETDYPLTDKSESCRSPSVNQTSKITVINSTCDSFYKDESHLLHLIASQGPVAVSVDASNWANYQGGVIRYHCGEVPANHAVQIVGYNLDAPIPYYIVKNSWGTDFGHDGYLYIEYNNDVCLWDYSCGHVRNVKADSVVGPLQRRSFRHVNNGP